MRQSSGGGPPVWQIAFNDLKVGDKLGTGLYGEVYKGTFQGYTEVAIKRLFFVQDQSIQKYIEREIDTLANVRHPNIVQFLGVACTDSDIFIVTDYIPGGDLKTKLHDTALEMGWRLRTGILKDVAAAMLYLHSRGIIHRDLKAANVLVSPDWKAKLCDFGLARKEPTGQSVQGPSVVGTDQWMAPEILNYRSQGYDRSADSFSYGIVIFEVITRQLPPERKLKDEFAFIHPVYESNLPTDMPRELWRLLVDCTVTNSASRLEFRQICPRITTIYNDLDPDAIKPPKVRRKRVPTESAPKKKKKRPTTTDTKTPAKPTRGH